MPSDHRYGLILAGGRGTRFWPRSRRGKAKQVLNFLGTGSLIQQTVERLRSVIPPERLWVLTNDYLRGEIIKQLPEVPRKQILAEPAQRNTAPCIGLAAHILHSADPDSVMGVFPADHVISRPSRYLRFLKPAFAAAEKGQIVLLGIQPRWAETGYGYLEFGDGVQPGSTKPLPILRMREKPDKATAQEYVASGRHFWNAGMFFWKTAVVLEEMRRFLPKTWTLLASLPLSSSRTFSSRVKDAFPLCENISIDFGILEKTGNLVGLATDDIGWNDVGSWDAVYELLDRDENGNCAVSDALCELSAGNYVDARGKFVALLGVRNLIVVDTPDALLVADRERAQEVGAIVKMLEKQKREELL